MEQRLGAALKASALPTVTAPVGLTRDAALPEEASEAVGATAVLSATAEAGGGSLFGDDAPWPTDEGSEAAFLADARARGEAPVPVVRGAAAVAAEDEKGPLPPLDSLVQRIPAEIRDTLEELFRVKYTSVQRVPAKNLKS